MTLSFIFLRKPHFLHKRRRPAFIARNIAHRGGAAESIENTVLAFDKGLTNGVEMLELDCHLTKDNQVVVHHDFSVDRTTGEDVFIRDINYDSLPKINTHVQLYYDSSKETRYIFLKRVMILLIGTVISCDNNPTNEELLRIPLLKDVFERYPKIPINIDVKENNDELIRQISKLIQEYQREDVTYWGSFNHVVCQKLTVENTSIVRFCSLKEAAGIVIAYWLGLLPFIPLTPGAFEVPIPGEVFQYDPTLTQEQMAGNKIDALVASWNTAAKKFFYISSKALFNDAAEKVRARREAGKQLVEELNKAVEANDNATTEQLLGK
ncbi:unnamed protein product [Rotaria sp. Silwood2]|nr:unnamed protein product [Rotaria sp. Silwood2]CAF2746895.1 unnamed protein product [Rotaria sp. Silwood2]CAF4004489.1 unnamed protein product [Rotaria sp. Silwood2]CAF4016122.1 unnamed protein product [Rotaria sp. Silwood2]